MPHLRIEAVVTSTPQAAQTSSPLRAFVDALSARGSTAPPRRWLLVFAHPDDEVLALGAHLEYLSNSRILTVTDGAPADGADAKDHGFPSLADYRATRRAELLCALGHAGLSPEIAPERNWRVPDQQASFHLQALSRALAEEIRQFRPEAILTHPFEGGHPDHDACAFGVHTAVRLAAVAPPAILEAPSYFAGPGGSMRTGSFLDGGSGTVAGFDLTPAEQANKAGRLACFRSQAQTLAQFAVERELFRLAPAYDFTRRPHPGQLFYEHFPWGMSGDAFCHLASEALAALFAEGGHSPQPPTAPFPATAAV